MKLSLVHGKTVFGAVPPRAAIEAVRDAFVRGVRGEWEMPSKVYLPSPPNGDFRAMPARGDGLAIVKWVTSFPGNRGTGMPTVIGLVLVSSAQTGEPVALVEGSAVTALRTGAAAAVAALALARSGAAGAGTIGCGLHGAWAARCLSAAGYSDGVCHDVDAAAALRLADELGWRAGGLHEALSCDVVTTVTPGHEPVVRVGDLHPGVHLNALGADGPGKAEVEIDAVVSCELFCDEWEQASHGGELTGAVQAGRVGRGDVTELGRVLTGEAPGRTSDESVTLFDSTGLAIQDLAIVALLMDLLRSGSLEAPAVEL